MAALLALVTIGLYWPVTSHDFVSFDDTDYVTANAHVQGGLRWASLGWVLTNLDVGLWHPLTWVSHMLDCQWFGLDPGWHHATSLLLHALNTVLLLLVLHRMTGAAWRSTVVAALFAVHPLHVESVAWVAERKDVLSTFFVLLTLWAYTRYAQKSVVSSSLAPQQALRTTDYGLRTAGPVSRFTLHVSLLYLLALTFFALGLMSKPMVVTLPLILLLVDYWPLRRFGPSTLNSQLSTLGRLLLEKLPFVMLSVLTGWITFHAAKGIGSLPSTAQFPMKDRIANVILSYAGYLGQTFWPRQLAVYYPFPATFSAWSVAGAALLLAGISVAAIWLLGRRPYVAVGWLWYLVTLLPVIGLIQLAGYSHADRYTYVPLIGVFVGLTWGACELTQRWRHRVLALSLAGGAAIALSLALTREQISYWKDSEALYRHAVAVTDNNSTAHNCLGNALELKGQTDEAIRQYQEALRIKPGYAQAHNNLGNALASTGRTNEAIHHFEEALRLNPDFVAAHYNLGCALGQKGQLAEAIRQYQEALRLNPASFQPYLPLAELLLRAGLLRDAAFHLEQFLRTCPRVRLEAPDSPTGAAVSVVLNDLAWLLATCPQADQRDGARAVRFAERACELTQYRRTRMVGTLAAAYAEAGRFPDAVTTAEKAIALATAAGDQVLLARNRQLLELYRAGRPYHEPAVPSQAQPPASQP
jgi:protein O-mannosyl-transferase